MFTKNCLNKKEQNTKLRHAGSSEPGATKPSLVHNLHKRLWATFSCVLRKLVEKNKKEEEMKLSVREEGLKQME